jgi:hypothetical protein
MRSERSEGHHEAAKALLFAVAGVVAVAVIWNVIMVMLY